MESIPEGFANQAGGYFAVGKRFASSLERLRKSWSQNDHADSKLLSGLGPLCASELLLRNEVAVDDLK